MLNKVGIALQPSVRASSGASGQPEKSTAGQGAAWRREMEKQEMALWLNHGPLPSAQREQTLFRPAPQSVVASEGPAAGPNRADDSAMPLEGEAHARNGDAQEPSHAAAPATNAQVSPPLVHTGAKAAPVDYSPATAAHQADTLTGGEMPPAVPMRELSPGGFAASVMSQLKQEIGFRINPSPAFAAASQAGQGGRPEVSTPAAAVRKVPGFDPSVGEPTSGQKSARPAVLDEPEELATQRSTPPSLPGDGEAPPVRIHTFWSDESVRIWVGTDGSAALDAQQLALAAQDLRRLLREQGATLESLTVNGETVLEQDAGQAPLQDGAPAPERPIVRTTQV